MSAAVAILVGFAMVLIWTSLPTSPMTPGRPWSMRRIRIYMWYSFFVNVFGFVAYVIAGDYGFWAWWDLAGAIFAGLWLWFNRKNKGRKRALKWLGAKSKALRDKVVKEYDEAARRLRPQFPPPYPA